MSLFRVVIPLFVLAVQALLYLRFNRWAEERRDDRRAFWVGGSVLFVVFNAAVVAIMIVGPRSRHIPDWLVYSGIIPFFLWHTATIFIAFVLFLGNVVAFPFRLVPRLKVMRKRGSRTRASRITPGRQPVDPQRRAFLQYGMYGVTAAAFGGTAYSMLIEDKQCDITTAQFILPHWPVQLSGFTLGFVSDIHSSMFMRKKDMDEYVALLNGLKPDLFVIGGDMANSYAEEILPFAEAFSDLSAPLGVYAVLGNHDFYTRQPDTITRRLEDAGIRTLRNERVAIRKNGAFFHLLGIDDAGTGKQAAQRFDRAIGNTSAQIPRIMVCHRPYFFEEAAERRIQLMLSGHTHGGQLVFGRFGRTAITPAALSSHYVWGRYQLADSQMYVSRGIGTVAVPVRLNCPPEITRIVIRSPKDRRSS
jgi:uncharacterized protein